ncbi:unnamed protein product [Caretta caretta]
MGSRLGEWAKLTPDSSSDIAAVASHITTITLDGSVLTPEILQAVVSTWTRSFWDQFCLAIHLQMQIWWEGQVSQMSIGIIPLWVQQDPKLDWDFRHSSSWTSKRPRWRLLVTDGPSQSLRNVGGSGFLLLKQEINRFGLMVKSSLDPLMEYRNQISGSPVPFGEEEDQKSQGSLVRLLEKVGCLP